MVETKKDYCTGSPEKVAGVYLGDCCKEHDTGYEFNSIRLIIASFIYGSLIYLLSGNWDWLVVGFIAMSHKFIGDWKLFNCVCKKRWYMFAYAVPMFITVSTVGTFFYLKAQYKIWRTSYEL